MKTNYERNRLLSLRYGDNSPAYARPGTVYFGLFTVMPTVGAGGTEVAGGSYARVGQTNNGTNFPDPTAGVMSNGVDITFPQATAPWGSVVGFGIFDAASAGNLLDFAALTTPRTVTTGDVLAFVAGQVSWTEN